ncbi:carboxypeptidase-like regulatory domain-containing protein [Bernardetia sp.]|uniref:carboxypeptidase-like regulatory domain-containing protein n=1 Tax=Bernardetia sp. TaxID=1937974 RepID=UPI0025BB5256|nr:carboxypeptidase-like regulatory domain-containing protein [Bernardetia sp.]
MKKIILSLLLILSFSYSALGQILVKGKVINKNGALPGATVQIKGTTKGTQTYIDGNFEIEVENEENILVFRFVGYETKELKVSEVISLKEIALEEAELTVCYVPYLPLKVNYWSGLFYNPYGASLSKMKYFSFLNRYIDFDIGYSTNFKNNSDFYGEFGTRILTRFISYKFQQTTFEDSDIENRIRTHFLESSSSLKFINLTYGVGHQSFRKKGIENHELQNYGISLGLRKSIKYIGSLSAKSFYWQDYWAWEANLNRRFFYRKLRLNTGVSYRQIAQDFKEINLTLGYMF